MPSWVLFFAADAYLTLSDLCDGKFGLLCDHHCFAVFQRAVDAAAVQLTADSNWIRV